MSNGAAEHSVLVALSATTDSGSFDFSYQLSQQPGSTPTAPVCPSTAQGQAAPCGTSGAGGVAGSGIINTNPMAMAASANIGPGGSNGFQVGVRVDPTTVWEVSNTDNGLTSAADDANVSGQSLPDFAQITEGTLGQREGAVAMMGMASPTGYLDLVQPAVTAASEVGTSNVDGVAVTQYELTIDPSSLATAPGVTPEEASTITSAIGVLSAEGSTTFRALVSIDASGFIRESISTVSFTDGGSVTLDAHFSDFGCAGTVLMPNQSGTSTPPVNCATSDTGVAPTTTTTVPSTPTTVTSPSATPSTTSTIPNTSSTTTTTTAPTTTTSTS
jgi:hypothetical protein